MARHTFVGGNFFMQRMLNKYRGDLGVMALPEEFEAAANRTVEHSKAKTAQVSIDRVDVIGGRLQADISVQNLSGHKFPTAYPSRRAWLHVTVKDRNGRVVFESGALNPNGSIQGNDNDADATRFEPHYTEINSAGSGADLRRHHGRRRQHADDRTADRGSLHQRQPTAAERLRQDGPSGQEIAPQGGAVNDADFTGGGDKIRYSDRRLAMPQGPFQVEAEFWFQPISFRWANNLKTVQRHGAAAIHAVTTMRCRPARP